VGGAGLVDDEAERVGNGLSSGADTLFILLPGLLSPIYGGL